MKVVWNRPIVGWALYDWANSAFATTVMTAFFPIFYKKYWAADLSATESTFYLGTTMSVSALVFAFSAPILGTLGDLLGIAKRGVVFFALLGIASCAALALVPKGHWQMALIINSLAWLGFAGANLFYDSLLLRVSDHESRDWVSCLGYGLGYLGGGLLIVVNALMVTKPELFGLADSSIGVRLSFLSVSLWWLIFTIPLILWVPRSKKNQSKNPAKISQGFRDLWQTLLKIKQRPQLIIFLLAFFFYIDGVHTIYKMAVDFALSIGLESGDLIKAIVIVQFVGFPATIAFSRIAGRLGNRNGILIGIVVYSLVCLFGAFISTATHFYILAIVLGLVQGGVQALSRSFYGNLIPSDSPAEFFGFYNMFGKFSAVLGPFIVGLVSLLSDNSRLSLLAILVLFAFGGFLLLKVKVEEAN